MVTIIKCHYTIGIMYCPAVELATQFLLCNQSWLLADQTQAFVDDQPVQCGCIMCMGVLERWPPTAASAALTALGCSVTPSAAGW